MCMLAMMGEMRISDQTLNRLNVLKAIQRHAPLSRSDLAILTGLSAGTVTQVTGDLVRRGLITEAKDEARRRTGRPRTNIEIVADAAVVIGVSFSGRALLHASFVDLTGNQIVAIDEPIVHTDSLADFAGEIARALEVAIAASPVPASAINRVGMAIPAIVDSNRGVVHFLATFASSPVPFADIIGERLGLKVTIENDMSCMARGEHWLGRVQEIDDFTLFHLGIAIGSAEYANGLPKLGANGFNGEFGHTKIAAGTEAPQCICGAQGCLGTIASIWGMTHAAGLISEVNAEAILNIGKTFQYFLDRVEAGDEKALAAIDAAAMQMGLAVSNHINSSDPGCVLILISNRRFMKMVSEKILLSIKKNTLENIFSRTKIIVDVENEDWRAKGAAALALEKLYLEEEIEMLPPMKSINRKVFSDKY